MPDIPVGLIDGRYRLGELLGTGGSASVFAATDTHSDATVAVKILHPHLVRSPLAREAILAEAVSVSRLQHPNVVSSLDAGVHDVGDGSLAWIAMERAPGRSLHDLVQSDGPLSIAHTAIVADGVLRALAAAHDIGLIHRDVSPSNIMIEMVGEELTVDGVRLLDFGLAAAAGNAAIGPTGREPAGDDPEPLAILGSANYTSPEHAAGLPVDERGDLYQVGGVLHFALTGRPPFPRSTVAATLAAHRSAPPPVPSVLRRDTPRELDRIVVKALLKHPADRFQTAAAMSAALAELSDLPAAGSTGILSPDPRTRVLDDRTELLSRAPRAHTTIVATGPANAPTATRRSGARTGRSRAGSGGWVAGILVAALIGSAWFLAASTPAVVQAEPTATPEPSPSVSSEASVPPRPAVAATNVATVPAIDLVPLGDARAALTAAGLTVGAVTIQNSERPGDTVLVVTPSAGSPLAVGTPVDLIVASGSNSVPDLRGRSEADAVNAVHAAGFTAVVRRVSDATTSQGFVVSSEPGADTVRRLGSDVVVTVSSTPAPIPTVPPTGTPTPSPPPDTQPPEVG